MKIIAIGDLHGRAVWKLIAGTQTYDKMVFIGDYFDSFDLDGQAQIDNFLELIEFKKANPERVVLLIGNHDFHYFPVATMVGEFYSGFQSKFCHQISHLLQVHKHFLQMAYKHGDFLFTHAGVTNTWLQSTFNQDRDNPIEVFGIAIDKYINDVFTYAPKHFYFNGRDPYGDDKTQSPIWVRPQSLNEDAYPAIHVVGHTRQKSIGIEPTRFLNQGSGFFIDALGTSGQYLVIDESGFQVKTVINEGAYS